MKTLLAAAVAVLVAVVASADPVVSPGLRVVAHDSSLIGTGQSSSPLSVVGGGTVGPGTTGDLAIFTGASTVGNYAGSSPAACSAGTSLTQVTESAAGVLSNSCSTVLTTPGTGLATSGAGDVHVNLTTTSCSAGQAETSTAANGTSGCSTFVNAGNNGVSVSGSTASLDSTYAPTFSGLTDTGPLATSGVITVTDTGTINDYNPTGLAGASVIVFNGASNLTLTGLTGGSNGRQITLCNISASSVSLNHENTGSTAADRFDFVSGTNGTLGTGGANKTACMQIIYLGGSVSRWTQQSMYASVSQTVGFSYAALQQFNASASVQGTLTLTGVAHFRSTSTTPPTVSSCGTGATITGSDTFFTLVTGTGATGCTITFGSSSWGSNHPACIFYPDAGGSLPAVSYSSVVSVSLGSGTAASATYEGHCGGVN